MLVYIASVGVKLVSRSKSEGTTYIPVSEETARRRDINVGKKTHQRIKKN